MTITLKPGPLDSSLYGPADGAPAPCIIILHGSEGPGAGWSHRFAAILAAHGFWACPFGYGTGDVWGAGAIRDVDISAIPANAAQIAALPEITAIPSSDMVRSSALGGVGGAGSGSGAATTSSACFGAVSVV